ncbi:MAG: hypothetical protein CVU98_06810 [Firmicutes bacterium HGW-Firmicutes-3]|jgi:vancomycin resistance protein YoaR|nr:MAG: hypothetical protein CVU98_06810 [Firmicutes bacterium HGW-Firmicutes-3]
MKKDIVILLVGLLLTMLLVVGCKERQVTKVMDVTINGITGEEVTADDQKESEKIEPKEATSTSEEETITQYESVENSNEPEAPSTKASELDEPSNEVIDEKKETVIIAKSENMEDIDERALMLKELDELLEDVLTTLDAVEEDDLSDDNMFDEGGD